MTPDKPLKIKTNLKIFKGRPDFAPYISVFFILMAFFMMASHFVPVAGVPVNLPTAVTRILPAERKAIVTVDSEGVIYFKDERYDNMDDFNRKLVEEAQAGMLIIRADAATPLEVIAQLIAMAQGHDMNTIIMTAEPEIIAETPFVETGNR